MLKLERYAIDRSPERIIIQLDQKTNAIVNLVIAVGVILVAVWLLSFTDPSTFYFLLLGVGALWLVGAILGFRTVETYVLTRDRVTYSASGRSEVISISSSDLSRVSLQKIVRPTGRQRKRVIFRWHVSLVDRQGAPFKGSFRLQGEESARRLASTIAEWYEIEVQPEPRPQPRTAE